MCSNRCHKPVAKGFTLIEVITGLALLGSVLTMAMLAKAQFSRQLVQADQRMLAIEAADQLLSQWWDNPQTLPRIASGQVHGDSGLVWQTHTESCVLHESMKTVITRLEIFDPRSEAGAEPLVSIALLLTDTAPVSPSPVQGTGVATK